MQELQEINKEEPKPEEANLSRQLPPTSNNLSSPIKIEIQEKEAQKLKKTDLNKDEHSHQKHSKIEDAKFLAYLNFWFGFKLTRVIRKYKRNLEPQDLDPLGINECSQTLEERFTAEYYKLREKWKGKRRLMSFLLIKLFKKDIAIQVVWQLLGAASRILASYFIYLMLVVLKDPERDIHDAYYPSIGLFVSYILDTYAYNHTIFNSAYVVNKIKLGIMGMLFRKTSKINAYAIHTTSLGKIINMTANDINNLENIHTFISLFLAPIILAGGWGLLFYFWGWSSFIGIIYFALIWIVERIVASHSYKLRFKKTGQTDLRINKLIEGIEGIKVLMLYAWELLFVRSVFRIRERELKFLKKFNFLDSVSRALVLSSNWVASFLIYLTYTGLGNEISPVLTFPTIYLMSYLRRICLYRTFQGFTFMEEMRSLFNRTNSIMNLPELASTKDTLQPLKQENSIEFENFSSVWPSIIQDQEEKTKDEKVLAISELNLEIEKGSLVTILGKTGSGKSTLLFSFTGEIEKLSGTIRYQGTYTYISHEPVLLFGNIKENIILDKDFDEQFFWRVLEACGLAENVRNLPLKEMTEIGERGAMLSSGQKALMGLARAIYSKADIYLLDGVLGGLDDKLAKGIFTKAILGILRGKTVLLVTNQLSFVKFANKIVIMENRKVKVQGTYEEILKETSHIELVSQLREYAMYADDETITKRDFPRRPIRLSGQPENENPLECAGQPKDLPEKEFKFSIEDEKWEEGKVTFKTYWNYFRILPNKFIIFFTLILFVAAESISWLFTLYMGLWSRQEISNVEGYSIIGGLAIASFFIHLVKLILYYNSMLTASNKLHRKMVYGVFQSPLEFFDKNPLGKIMNRFSNDMGILDKFLMQALLDFLEGFIAFWVSLLALWTRDFWIFISAAFLFIFSTSIILWSRKALRQVRGLELITKSPLYSLFVMNVSDIVIIRSHGNIEDLLKVFFKKADDHSRASITYSACTRFMSFLMDLSTDLIVIGTFCVFLAIPDSPLRYGFFLNMLANLPITMQWILKNFITMHLLMASVARVLRCCEKYQKPDLIRASDKKLLENGWPQYGKIEVRNTTMRHGEDSEPILKHLSFEAQAGEKIAIVGNTASGMSSIVSMLVRFYNIGELPEEESFIKIDGVDTRTLGLHLLRRNITTILGDSSLFSTTIRENLDPWGNYTEQQLWEVLDCVGLKDFVESLPLKMDTRLSKGSSVLSTGQKQLLSLARGLLKECKVLILDDATAYVDFATEKAVHKRVFKKVKNITVVSTFHRLLSIANYDKAFVIANGEKIEFGEPYRLLVENIGDEFITHNSGYFVELVRNTEPKFSDKIFKSTFLTHLRRCQDFGSSQNVLNRNFGNEGILLCHLSKSQTQPRNQLKISSNITRFFLGTKNDQSKKKFQKAKSCSF